MGSEIESLGVFLCRVWGIRRFRESSEWSFQFDYVNDCWTVDFYVFVKNLDVYSSKEFAELRKVIRSLE